MIYYSHVNEDNSVERNVLLANPAQTLFVIAGSGERVIALLDCPTLDTVHLIDNNSEALFLCELKIKALEHFDTDAYLAFTGFRDSEDLRWKQFEVLKATLSAACRNYWESGRKEIEAGICNCGHFEQFLRRASPLFRFFLGKNFYQCFTTPKSEWKEFPDFRWRIVKAAFTSRWTYWLFGMKDSAFISDDSALRFIPAALQQSLDAADGVANSCLFHLVFNNNLLQMPEENLPPSFRKPVLQSIRKALLTGRLKVHYHLGDVQEVLNKIDTNTEGNRFYSMSDILSFVDIEYQKTLINLIASRKPGYNSVVFRAFVRNRIMEEQAVDLKQQFDTFQDLSAAERTHFYQVFQVTV